MFPASTRQGGDCMAFPDTCKTPTPVGTIPTPYPNTAQLMQANPTTCPTKVTIMNQAPITKQTMIPMTSGDEAGAAGGVVSGMIKGPAQPKTGSIKVKFEGNPAVYQTCMWGQNGTNANAPAGIQATPSQTKVIINM
jgi:hypothetical protein